MSPGFGMLFNPPSDLVAPPHNQGNLAAGVFIGSQPVKQGAANNDGSSAIVLNRFLSPGNRRRNEAERSWNSRQPTSGFVAPLLCVCVCTHKHTHFTTRLTSQLRERLHANQPATPTGNPSPQNQAICTLYLTSCLFLPLPVSSQEEVDTLQQNLTVCS